MASHSLLVNFSLIDGVTALFLLICMADDLKNQKIHNGITVTFVVLLLILRPLVGWGSFQSGLLGFAIALFLSLPLFWARILGGGDLKLYMALGLATSVEGSIQILIYSFFWGGLIGLFKALLEGQLLLLAKNTISILGRKPVATGKFHHLPFSVALFFGWLSFISLRGGPL